jgi:glycosyltransferase involved in cell wall biosynthesis
MAIVRLGAFTPAANTSYALYNVTTSYLVSVIASNTSSIPEVVGDAGMLLDPLDVDGFYEAMKSMLESPELRKSYSEKSLSRSSLFSWNKCAQETMGVYNKVLGNT